MEWVRGGHEGSLFSHFLSFSLAFHLAFCYCFLKFLAWHEQYSNFSFTKHCSHNCEPHLYTHEQCSRHCYPHLPLTLSIHLPPTHPPTHTLPVWVPSRTASSLTGSQNSIASPEGGGNFTQQPQTPLTDRGIFLSAHSSLYLSGNQYMKYLKIAMRD